MLSRFGRWPGIAGVRLEPPEALEKDDRMRRHEGGGEELPEKTPATRRVTLLRRRGKGIEV